MTALVEDLLLLARLDSGRPLEREAVDLSRLLLEAVNDARVVDPRRQHRHRHRDLVRLHGPRRRAGLPPELAPRAFERFVRGDVDTTVTVTLPR